MRKSPHQKTLLQRIEESTKRHAVPMGFNKPKNKDMSMRDLLAKTRKKTISENEEVVPMEKQLSGAEQKEHERTMSNFFDNENVTITYEPVLVADDMVFWAGTVDGQLKFAYIIAPNEADSGVKIERSPDFDPNNEDNQRVEKKIVDYYQSFAKYWRENELEK